MHDLEIVNGRKSMFSVGETPWHDADGSTVIGSAPSLEEGIRLMNAAYPLLKVRLDAVLEDGVRVPVDSAFAIVRGDTKVSLGVVGKVYTPVDNETVFNYALGEAVKSGRIALETGGVLAHGSRAWMMGRIQASALSEHAQRSLADGIIPFFVAVADHTGKARIRLRLTPIRVVCRNTLEASELNNLADVGIRHSTGAAERVKDASERLIENVVSGYDRFAAEKDLMEALQLTEEQMRALVVYPAIGEHPTRRKDYDALARKADSVVNRYENRRDEITRLWHAGTGHSGDDSSWEAYNGLVECVDHNKALFPARSGVYRTASLLDGVLAATKQNALDAILRYAEHETTLDQIVNQAQATMAA